MMSSIPVTTDAVRKCWGPLPGSPRRPRAEPPFGTDLALSATWRIVIQNRALGAGICHPRGGYRGSGRDLAAGQDVGVGQPSRGAEHQGKGYGRFAVGELCQEARRRGHHRLTVSYHAGEHGPEDFYRRLGFNPTGEYNEGETVADRILLASGDD